MALRVQIVRAPIFENAKFVNNRDPLAIDVGESALATEPSPKSRSSKGEASARACRSQTARTDL